MATRAGASSVAHTYPSSTTRAHSARSWARASCLQELAAAASRGLAGAAPARQASSGTDCGGLNVDRFGPSAHRQAQQTGPPRHTGAGQPVTASRRLRPPVSGRCPVATFGAAPLRHRPSASGSAPGLAPGSSVSPRSQDGVPPLPGQGEAPRLAQRTRNPPRSITRPGRAFSLNET